MNGGRLLTGRTRPFLVRHAGALVWAGVLAWLGYIAFAIATGRGFRIGWIGVLFVLFVVAALAAAWSSWQRQMAIRESALPQFLKRKLRDAYPALDGRDCDLVERGFRDFFLACARSDGKFVAMPSKVVDGYWHEFILHTRAYKAWCERTLGRFLHHTPAEALGGTASDNDGLRRAWYWSCREGSIDPRRPTRLPLLFALDAKLGIAGGFHYVTDCRGLTTRAGVAGAAGGAAHCGTSFGDGSFSGDAETMGGVESSSSSDGDGGSSGGDGGGCGGGGGD